jgi:hypothetical protein
MNTDRILWLSIFAGPALWFVNLEANFALANSLCIPNVKVALYLISLVTFAASAFAGLAAHRAWVRLGREMPTEGAGAIPRARIMAVFGMLLNAMACLTILAQAVPELILRACE